MTVWIDVPDFKKKLLFLLKRPGYFSFKGKRQQITTPELLASALDINYATLIRWRDRDRIPTHKIQRFTEIFFLQREWLSEPYDRFEDLCKGSPIKQTWLALLARAPDRDVGTITQVEPPPAPHTLQAGRPRNRLRSLPTVPKGAIINVSFRLKTEWAGWHAALFSEDSSGFLCLLPHYAGEPEYPTVLLTLPPKISYDLIGLRVDEDVSGRHSFVLIATSTPLPSDLNELLRQDIEGKELEPTLDRLASHVAPLCTFPNDSNATDKPSAIIRRLEYSVV